MKYRKEYYDYESPYGEGIRKVPTQLPPVKDDHQSYGSGLSAAELIVWRDTLSRG